MLFLLQKEKNGAVMCCNQQNIKNICRGLKNVNVLYNNFCGLLFVKKTETFVGYCVAIVVKSKFVIRR